MKMWEGRSKEICGRGVARVFGQEISRLVWGFLWHLLDLLIYILFYFYSQWVKLYLNWISNKWFIVISIKRDLDLRLGLVIGCILIQKRK